MKTYRILSWNVNGFRAVYKKGFVEWLHKEQPDILCLQETKAEEIQVTKELASIQGYHWLFCSGLRKGYSGTALFAKQKPIEVTRAMGHDPFDNEGRLLIVTYPEFVLCNVYFPNGGSGSERLKYKMDFYAHFHGFANGLRGRGRDVIVCGDVNTAHKEIDLARPKENVKVSGFLPEERAWVESFLASGFVDTFRMFNDKPGQYTWWDMKTGARARNVGWRIDYFLVNEEMKGRVKDAWIMPEVTGSDHCPIGLEVVYP